MRLMLFVCLPMVFLLGGCRSQKSAKSDPEAIQGTWQLLSFEVDGKGSNEMENAQWVFTKDAVTFKKPGREMAAGTAKSGQPMIRKTPDMESQGTFRLDPGKNPKEIDLTMEVDGNERNTSGIYAVEKEKLTLGIPMKKDGGRPKSWSEQGIAVFTLQRVK